MVAAIVSTGSRAFARAPDRHVASTHVYLTRYRCMPLLPCDARRPDFVVILHGLMRTTSDSNAKSFDSTHGYMDLEDHPKTAEATHREEVKLKVRTFLDDPSSSMAVSDHPVTAT